jgi:hypothetical protein
MTAVGEDAVAFALYDLLTLIQINQFIILYKLFFMHAP